MRVNIVDLFRISSIAVLNLAHSFPRPWNNSNPLKAQTIPDPHAGQIVGIYEVKNTPSISQFTCIPLERAP